jgi:hypothetical protein
MLILGVDVRSQARAGEAIWMPQFVTLWIEGMARCTIFRRLTETDGMRVHLVWVDVAKFTKLLSSWIPSK